MNRRHFLLAPLLAVRTQGAGTQDWPQWRGPDRNGISRETGLLASWPAAGPRQTWTVTELGFGFSSPAIAGDSMYVQGTRGNESMVWRLNRGTGKTIWGTPLGSWLKEQNGSGPRSTPTVQGELLWALAEGGDLACIRTRDGSIAWRKNLAQEYRAARPNWFYAESPLVDGDHVIVTPGGAGGMVALNKNTGREVWAARELRDDAAYSSAIAFDVDGVRVYTTVTSRAAVGVRASDGKVMWRYERVANRNANACTPIVDKNRVFYSTQYDTGCALLRLKAVRGAVQADEVYFSRNMMNLSGGAVLVNGFVYGYSNLVLTCLDLETAAIRWRNRGVGVGSVVYADGKLYLLSESNVVGLVQAAPEGYRELGRFQIPDQGFPSSAHPVVCGGHLYIRNQSMLRCYRVAG